eukprot:scaffold907_cov398-Prasinococcus_capsulatus_cf.AAC.22
MDAVSGARSACTPSGVRVPGPGPNGHFEAFQKVGAPVVRFAAPGRNVPAPPRVCMPDEQVRPCRIKGRWYLHRCSIRMLDEPYIMKSRCRRCVIHNHDRLATTS